MIEYPLEVVVIWYQQGAAEANLKHIEANLMKMQPAGSC